MSMINIISKGNLKNNKSKSILIIISIALTTCLLVSIGILGNKFADGMKKGAIERAGSHHSRYRGVDSKQVDILNNHLSVDQVGVIGNLGSIKENNMRLDVAHVNNSYIKFTNLELLSGKLPEKIGEIALTDIHLESLNIDKVLDSKVNIKYYVDDRLVEGTYKLTGIIKGNEKSKEEKIYSAIVSNEEYLKEKGDDATYTAFISIDNANKLSKNDIKFMIKDIAKGIHVQDEKIIINDDYLNNLKPGMGSMLGQLFAGIIVIMSAIMVIYNIFYFSVNSKIKDYGKLRAVGATKKQIKRIILKEGLFLSIIGIPIGLILGIFLGEIVIGTILREPINLFNTKQILILVVATISTLLAVIISLIKPMRVAANISPVEAMKYNEFGENESKRKNYYNEIDLKKLTKINLKRNKKRTIITCLSLSFSAILFVSASILMNAFDSEKMAREHHPSDFSIGLTNYSFGNNLSYNEDELPLYNDLQLESPLNEEFIDELKNVAGIKSVSKERKIRMKQIVPTMIEEEFSSINSFSRDEVEKLNKNIKEGIFDTDKYIENNGIAFSSAAFKEYYGDIKIGDRVVLEIFDGKEKIEKEFTVMAVTDSRGTYMLPEEVFESMFKSNTTSNININIHEEKYDEIDNYLTSIAQSDKYLSIGRIKDSIKEMKEANMITNVIGYGLITIIFIISLMNFINTLISSILSRKKEFGMLQAIGLSNKQLQNILQKEGLFYVIITLFSGLVVGTIGGGIGIQIMKATGVSYAAFGIPISVILFLILLPLIGLITNILIIKNMNKESIVDLIRYND